MDGDVTGNDVTSGSVLAGVGGAPAQFGVVGDDRVRWFPARLRAVDGREAVEPRRHAGVLGTSFGDTAHALSQPGTT